MRKLPNKSFWVMLGLFAIPLLITTDLHARCIVGLFGRHFIVSASCAEVADCLDPDPNCVDLPIMASSGGPSVDVKSRTEASIVIGKDKFLLASDEAQAKFDAIWDKKKGKINMAKLERALAPILQKNGTVSTKRFQEKTK